MSTCVKIKGKKRNLCAGDLDKIITINNRKIAPPTTDDDTDYSEDFTQVNFDDTLAMVLTTKKGTLFFGNDTNVDRTIDIEFYIYFLSGIVDVAGIWIEFEGSNYDLLAVEDLDKRHEVLRLICSERGPSDKAVNSA